MATFFRTLFPKAAYASLLALAINVSAHSAPLNLQDVPLFLTASVDPNVLINMSVETPMGGAAYTDNTGIPAGCGGRVTVGGNNGIGTCYFPTTEYLGYFDPNKCYTYSSNQFNPSGATGANHTCTVKWSGNFLNWVSMTAIDMFILNMTGGNRTTDSTTETVIRRARKTDNNSWFPRKALNADVNVAPSTVTPYDDATLYFHNTTWGFNVGTSFDKATSKDDETPNRGKYTTAVRVCSSAAGLEGNCVAYGDSPTYYKPEGLIQKNATSKRFGVLSYTLDNSDSRDGGVLRSNMKYVGPTLPDGSTNAAREYETTGLLRTNPDGASDGLNSGVINYINKFSDAGYKSKDPIGELFYEGIRYFKNLGPTPEYSSDLTAAQYGGFAIVTDWDDPIQHRCQKNFTVAINDANPWYDKKLPGTSFTSETLIGAAGVSYTLGGEDYDEPSNADPDIDVTALTNRVGELEGLNGTTWSNNGTWQVTDAEGDVTASGQNDSVGGGAGTFDNSLSDKVVANLGEVMGTSPAIQKQNAYYIAGLAYYANTTDLRTEAEMGNDRGIQTVQSFVIDTQEFNANPLDGPKNMLWLAGKYGGFADANGDGIPQASEWDADQDGIPDNYVLATNPVNLTAGLNRAFSFIDDQTASASSASVNSGSISSETRVYQAKFDPDDWTGQLLSFPVGDDGVLGIEGKPGVPEWDAATEIPAAASRKIITRNSNGTAVAFQWSDLDATRKLQIDPTYVADDTLGTALVNYLRGDASNEEPAGLDFRARPITKLGDIVSSAPIFVGEPRFSYRDNLEDEPYSAFRLAYSDIDGDGADVGRTQVVYAGANDGMLHAFNAATGEELLGFIPGSVFANLPTLSDVNYSHKFFVDGPPNMGDVFINGEWQTVLIGGLNKGGQGIYALNITDPSNFSEDNADDIVLWEFTDSDANGATGGITGDADLGYTYSQPAIVRLQNGKWGAVFGNGYNNTAAVGAQSTTGHAVLYIVDIENGQLIKKIDTKVGSPTTPNGLSTPAAVDLNGDAIVDYIYAGDLRGNMWKFDVRNPDPGNWEVAYGNSTTPLPLFTATSQPITSRPEIIRGRRGVGMMVLFGTGKYLETTDKIIPVTPEIQAYYGLHDQNTGVDATDRITALTDLAQQSILLEKTVVFEDTPFGDLTYAIRETSKVGTGGAGKGWYLNLRSPDAPNGKGYQGERQISNSIVRAGRVIFTTLIPDGDPCNFGGNSWLMELDALSGGQLAATPFDLNRDGVFDENDYVTGADGTRIPISGLQPDVGITPEPGVLIGEGGTKEFKYNPGTTGTISVTVENPGEGASGRQSWRQIR